MYDWIKMKLINLELKNHNTKIHKQIAAIPDYLLPIMEIFYTIEGESLHIGEPRILIRVGGCLVGCFNCDSSHTWGLKKSNLMTIPQIMAEVFKLSPVQHVSVTGGEPMHFIPQVVTLAKELRSYGYKTNLETSGMILDSEVFDYFDYVSLDIKTPSSKIILDEATINIIKHCWLSHSGAQLKAVITDSNDLNWIKDNFGDLLLQRKGKTLVLTPAAGDDFTVERMSNIVSMILNWNEGFNIRIIPQIHRLLGFR